MNKSDPVIFEADHSEDHSFNVDDAPQIDAHTSAMGIITARTARRTGWLGRILMLSIGGLLALVISMAFWNFVINLTTQNVILGRIALGLFIIIGVISTLYILKEILAIWRLGRVDKLRQNIRDAWVSASIEDAKSATKDVAKLVKKHDKNTWENNKNDIFDSKELLEFSERELLSQLDMEAQNEIQKRARQVAVVTAFVPLALIDLITVLTANIGMIRSIAEIYGGRPGLIGGWRLFQKVATHLVATGAVAVGDDMIGSLLGGGALSKLSRRFGEGVINAALTARVGIATMEVCRPMDFRALNKPTTSGIASKSLAGFTNSTK